MTRARPSLTSFRFRPALTGVLCASVIAFATNAGAASAAAIEINKFAFAPKEITVTPGTNVVWTNHDETPHTIAASDKSFASKGLDTDDKYEHTFDAEGDFTYVCTLHPFMTGVVHVRKK
ncbi:MAG TPA: cupredoxin family copper-binding protein [Casimicrobiaceae bacterium]|nr:cupredoxin family copper-binding protein [Casimicrobiaceae bacterium]